MNKTKLIMMVFTMVVALSLLGFSGETFADQTLYGYIYSGAEWGGKIHSIDPSSGDSTYLSNTVGVFDNFEWGVSSIWAYRFGGPGGIGYSVDPSTGSWELLSRDLTAIASSSFAYTGSTFYTLKNGNLYNVDPNDFSWTLIRDNTGLNAINYYNSTLYGVGGSSLYTVNTTTGETASIGSGTFRPYNVAVVDGIMYGLGADAACTSSCINNYFSIALNTGEHSLINSNTVFEYITASPDVVPEPISSVLFVAGGTLLAGRRYMKRKKKT
jgi:hypothetical protein